MCLTLSAIQCVDQGLLFEAYTWERLSLYVGHHAAFTADMGILWRVRRQRASVGSELSSTPCVDGFVLDRDDLLFDDLRFGIIYI